MSVKIFAAIAAVAATPAHAQCGPPDEDVPALHDSLLVSTQWLAAHLRDTNLVIIHVDHMSNGYAQAHLPGAKHLDAMAFTTGNFDLPPLATIDSVAESLGIGPTTRVVIYGDPWVTGMVFVALDQLGHGDRTALLDGGLDQWQAEHRQVQTQVQIQVQKVTGNRVRERPRPGVVADAAWVRAHLADDRVAVLDVRTADEYSGAMSHGEERGGHIPGARFVPWLQTFEKPADAEQSHGSRLKSPGELRTMFRLAGVHRGVTPVVYCTVGMRASHMYFVLRYLGYDPKFYDGSITDWNRHTGFPLTTGTARGTP